MLDTLAEDDVTLAGQTDQAIGFGQATASGHQQAVDQSRGTHANNTQGLDNNMQGLSSNMQGNGTHTQETDANMQGTHSNVQGIDSNMPGADSNMQEVESMRDKANGAAETSSTATGGVTNAEEETAVAGHAPQLAVLASLDQASLAHFSLIQICSHFSFGFGSRTSVCF